MSATLTAPAVRPAAGVVVGRGRRNARRSAIARARATSSPSKPDDDDDSPDAAVVAHRDDVSRRRLTLGSAAALVALPNLGVAPGHGSALAAEPLKSSFYDYTVEQYGKPFDLGAFKGDVTVVLNVASE